MNQWKIEDQQNLGMSTYRLHEILIRLGCSARCLPSWKAKHCPVELPSRSSSTLQNATTVYNFNSRVIFKHLEGYLHNANNERLRENARVTRSCLGFFLCLYSHISSAGQHLIYSIWFWPDSLTETKKLNKIRRTKSWGLLRFSY